MPLGDKQVKRLVEHAYAGAPEGGMHITRFAMYQRLAGMLAEHDAPDRTMLAIAGSSRLGRAMGLTRTAVRDALHPQYDLAALALPDASFDFVVSDQVLEHVAGGPVACFEETARVLRPGGFAVHATCLINEIHQPPGDFWRFTPFALRMLSERVGLEVLEADGWGNRAASQLVQMGFRRRPVPEDPANPIHRIATDNDPQHPIVTWVVARRPAPSSAG